MLAGALCTVMLAAVAAFHLASWLVVDNDAEPADAAVVLGGGGGSRLAKGLALFEQGQVKTLILVDTKARSWDGMLARLCPECREEGKPITILTGSINTLTDAQLVHEHCVRRGIERIVVVTDPYHSRRASIMFGRQFADSGIRVTTVSSGDYGDRRSPAEPWWRDEGTLRMVWAEAGKIGAFLLMSLLDPGSQVGGPRT